MSGKHTAGPWIAVMQFGSWMVRQDPKDWDGNGYQHICGLPAGKKLSHYGDMFAANARLISAAPELLALVGELADELERIARPEDGIGKLRHRARSTLRKASGEE